MQLNRQSRSGFPQVSELYTRLLDRDGLPGPVDVLVRISIGIAIAIDFEFSDNIRSARRPHAAPLYSICPSMILCVINASSVNNDDVAVRAVVAQPI